MEKMLEGLQVKATAVGIGINQPNKGMGIAVVKVLQTQVTTLAKS